GRCVGVDCPARGGAAAVASDRPATAAGFARHDAAGCFPILLAHGCAQRFSRGQLLAHWILLYGLQQENLICCSNQKGYSQQRAAAARPAREGARSFTASLVSSNASGRNQ